MRPAYQLLALLLVGCGGDDGDVTRAPAIIYMASVDGPARLPWLVAVGADGKDSRVLFDTTAEIWSPVVDPRGGTVLVLVYDGLGGHSWRTVDATGGSSHPFDTPSDAWDPHWSPEGSRIAWTRTDAGNNTLIGISSAPGTTLDILTPPGFQTTSRMSWSPDGTRLAIERRYLNGDFDIYLAPVTGAPTPLVEGADLDFGPGWSPDGSRIAFVRYTESEATTGIYTIAPDGSGLHQVAVGVFSAEIYWSPDGRTLASARYAGPNNDYQLVTIDVASGTLATPFAPSTLFEYTSTPWSADGTFLLATDAGAGDRQAVFVNSASIGSRLQVSPDSVRASFVSWLVPGAGQ